MKIYRLAEYHKLCDTNNEKYYLELTKMAEMNYQEWYHYYSTHLNVYPSAESMAELWHQAGQGNDIQMLDVIVCVDPSNLDVLGMCALEYNELQPRCKNIDMNKIYLTNLLVIPSARSQGIAVKLIDYCQGWVAAKRPELNRLYLNCQPKLLAFYLNRGWERSETETGLADWYEMFIYL